MKKQRERKDLRPLLALNFDVFDESSDEDSSDTESLRTKLANMKMRDPSPATFEKDAKMFSGAI